MLIVHKIKFDKEGLTITQHIDQSAAENSEPLVEGNSLSARYSDSKAANVLRASTAASGSGGGAPFVPLKKPGGGNGPFPTGPGTSPITIIGPIFFGCPIPCAEDDEKEKE